VTSAHALSKSIKEGKSFKEEFEKTGIPQQINFQKQLIDALLKAPPQLRVIFLRKVLTEL